MRHKEICVTRGMRPWSNAYHAPTDMDAEGASLYMNDPHHSAPLEQLSWLSCAMSDVGHIRKANEDSFLDAREQRLWVVADGMGGHSRGDRASQTIIEKLVSFTPSNDVDATLDDLKQRLHAANDACRSLGDGKVMGSTVAAMYTHLNVCYLLWAGDSRIYRLRGGILSQLTEDHSLVQELCRMGELTPEEAENHPSSNVITRAIGVHDSLQIATEQLEVKPGDRYLLCSDGLFKDVKREEIESQLSSVSAEQSLRGLVKQALDRGGSDNVTAIVVQAGFD